MPGCNAHHNLMEEYEDKSKRFQRQERYLLSIAGVLGITATLRAFTTDGITITAVTLLSGATLFAVFGLIRFFSGGRSAFSNTKKVIIVLAGVHIVSTLFFFPPEDIVNQRPVLTLDHAVHYYQVVRAGEICRDSFCLHAYDPYFMAGHPGGTVFDIDSKGTELFCALLRFMGSARALKLFVLLAHLLMVATIYYGCRRLDYRYDECVYATLLLLAFWHWGRPYAGDFRFAGMFAFLFVTHLSFYLVGAFNSFLERDSSWRFFIIGPLTFLVHPTAAVLLPIPFIALFIVQRLRIADGRLRYAWAKGILFRLILWCIIVFAVNAIWIFPLMKYLDIKLPSQTFLQIKGITGLMAILIKPGNIPPIGVCLLAIIGSVRLYTEKRYKEFFVPASGALFLFLLASYGVYIPAFDQMEPGRFLYSALIFIIPLAGAGLRICLEIVGRLTRKRSQVKYTTAIVVFLFVIPPWLGFISARSFFKHTLSTTMSPEMKSLVAALQENTDSSGRLMVEDGPAWRYGHSHFPSILPLITGVEQIGGPYPHTFIKHHFATFQTTKTMGKPLLNWEAGAFTEYLELYNIRWIMTASLPATTFIEEKTIFERIWSSDHFTLWLVPGNSTFTDIAGISVRATYNLIEVAISAPDNFPPPDRILLKYHWDPALRVDPPARISQIMFLDDPVPFISLEPNGESLVRITYGY
jgi:hypothetical protein